MLSPVSWEMYLTPASSAKAVSRESRTFCLATVASARFRAATSSRNLLTASLDADEGGVRAPALPGPEEVLARFPRAHVERPPNLLAAKRSLDPERALAAPVLPAFGSMTAVPEMPPVEGQHLNGIARNTHTAILSPLSYLFYYVYNGGGGGSRTRVRKSADERAYKLSPA